MSCRMNGITMSEGRHNYAMMPATPACDNRHPVDLRPLTREQILAMPGVSLLPARKCPMAKHVIKYTPKESRRVYGRISDSDLAGMVKQYQAKTPMDQIGQNFGRDRCTVREALKRIGVYVPVYKSRIRGEHLAKSGGAK